MTSLSTRSSNAIKFAAGESGGILFDSAEKAGQARSVDLSVGRHPCFQHALLSFSTIARSPEAILTFLSTLCVFFALLSFRVVDDNRLTSWQWVFAEADMLSASFFLVAGLMLAWYLSVIELSRHYVVPILIVFSYFIGILHWGSPEVIVDAGRYFTQAKYLELYGIGYYLGEWGRGIMAWTDLPLVPFIYGLMFKVFGESRTAIQVVNTLFFSGAVVITYLIGKDLWNEHVGIYGAVMLLAIPYLHTQVPLMLVDVPAMFFLSLAVLVFIRALKWKGFLLPVLAAVCISLAMLAKYSNWLMLSILPIITLVLIKVEDNRATRQHILRQNFIVLVCLSMLIGLLLLWRYEVLAQQIGLLMTYQLPALGGWSESHLSTFLFQVHPFVSIAAIASMYFAYKNRDLKYLIISWMLLLILVIDITRARYVLITFPMLSLMAGYAIAHIETIRFRRYLALCTVLSASIFSIVGFASFLGGASASNIQHAGEYVDSLNVGGDVSAVEVITLSQTRSAINPVMSIPLFDLHSQKQITYSGDGVNDIKTQLNNHQRSPLRFTWEYDLPNYYLHKNENTENIVVVISDSNKKILPIDVTERLSGYYLDRRFEKDEKIFLYTTIVDVYLPVKKKIKASPYRNYL